MPKRRSLALAVGLLLAAAALPWGSASAQSPTARKVTFTMGTLEDLVSPNPFKATGGSDFETLFLAYDMLYNFGQQDLSPVAGLAYYPPEESADGKTWTFKIRPGVKWSDGVPLTAKDIAFTYNFINEQHLSVFAPELGNSLSKDALEAPDDTTLIWHMEEPSLAPLHPPWVPILPEHVWSKYWGKENRTISEVPNVPAVGSGPFVLTEWQQGRYWKMEANKDYWGGAPPVDEVVFRVYDTPEALKLALMTGEVDAADGLPPTIFQGLLDQPNIVANVASPRWWDDLAFNFEGTADPSLHNEKVRLAVAYSIDKQAIVDRVFLGFGTPGTTIISPVVTRWHWEPPAEQLLDQAGYEDVNRDGFRETPNGEPWQLQVTTITDWSSSVPEGKLIAGWMNDIGIKTSTKAVSEAKATDLWWQQDFDMYVWGWGTTPDPQFYLSIFTTDQCLQWSDGCYSDPAYDKMYEEQTTAADLADRQRIVDQMQQFIYEKNPLVALVYENDLQAYRNDRYTGFVKQPEPNGAWFYTLGNWSYLNIRPVKASASAKEAGGGTNAGIWVGVGVALLLVLVALVVLRRRSRRQEEVE